MAEHTPSTNIPKTGSIGPDQSISVILAQGQVREGLSRVIIVGIVLAIIAIGGVVVLLTKPESAKDVWLIIGPIISGAIGFLLGHKQSEKS